MWKQVRFAMAGAGLSLVIALAGYSWPRAASQRAPSKEIEVPSLRAVVVSALLKGSVAGVLIGLGWSSVRSRNRLDAPDDSRLD